MIGGGTMGRVVKAVLVVGLVLVAAPTGWGSLWATNCHGDGCLGILVLWAVGLLFALLVVLGLIVRGLVIRWRNGKFPQQTWRLCGIALAFWGGIVALGYFFANTRS
ncbi:hypothetical protein SM19410_07055 [Xanthomonas hortorum pv. gardneri]|nr:hypothetical protein BJD10_22010 [Xanthomonas hortorum pv. gardneri]ASW47793.1 hypothetical protein XJ27_18920 [Xanthomonas hortorum]EGD16685.1 hypothetical protein XGA_4746 [Xanthomonas hortorum ATCC 19865]APP86203.1 hypothetical protein BI317_20715 [Xanthomonas hortorum pv. gardneri]KLA99143.1 hypothetical protein SM19410_07055 [Xanthomonas hortorum pv. gardneri]